MAKRPPLSPEARAKISAANKGKPSPNKGKVASLETRGKISAKLQGNTNRLGSKHSVESRAKISVAMKGRPSPKKGMKGKPVSAITRAKISATKKAKPRIVPRPPRFF